MDNYVIKENKKLRKGYTTGTCAAAAAGCAARALIAGEAVDSIKIMTPGGMTFQIPVIETKLGEGWASCAVEKDSGDDPDVTNGVLVFATVFQAGDGIQLKGGEGVGTITKPGLACAVGEPAINPVPRSMIEEQLCLAAHDLDYEGGFIAEISIPAGIELAAKTFNPKLGIEGGISILGTSGIVEPMSEDALIETIKLELNMKKAAGLNQVILTPGNYGETFIKEKMGMEKGNAVKCSNFIGDALDHCRKCEFSEVVLVGHIGKLIKVAAGMMNTHSKYGDRRMETLIDHVRMQGGNTELENTLSACVTTEDALAELRKYNEDLSNQAMESIVQSVQRQIESRLGVGINADVVLYSNVFGLLGST